MSDKEFIWTDELVKEIIIEGRCVGQHIDDTIERFKQSKQPIPDYIIISFRHKSSGRIWAKIDGGKFEADFSHTYRRVISPLSYFLRNLDNYEIHSVKLLSDSEIFVIADEFELGMMAAYTNSSGTYYKGRIERFEIENNTIKVHDRNTSVYLQSISKVKPKLPLFTPLTEMNLQVTSPPQKLYVNGIEYIPNLNSKQ